MVKGQFFIIAAVLVIGALLAFRSFLSIYATEEELQRQEQSIADRQLANIRDEMRSAVAVASAQQQPNASAIAMVYNFSQLVREKDVHIIYVIASANTTTKNISITVGNFLGEPVNVTLNLSNATPAGYAIGLLGDKRNETRQFNTSAHGPVMVTLSYMRQTENMSDSFTIDTSAHALAAFFDIEYDEQDARLRVKTTFNTTLNRTR